MVVTIKIEVEQTKVTEPTPVTRRNFDEPSIPSVETTTNKFQIQDESITVAIRKAHAALSVIHSEPWEGKTQTDA